MEPVTIYESIVHRITEQILEILSSMNTGINSIEDMRNTKIVPSKPPKGHGDIAFPLFPLARILRKAPQKIAEEVAEKLNAREGFTSIARAVAEGGYLNIHIHGEYLVSRVLKAVDDGSIFKFNRTPQKVILEHTSANPNGPLHVGRARNPIIGDTMARILRLYGDDVEVQYYVCLLYTSPSPRD